MKELKLLDNPIASDTFYEDVLLGILYSMMFCRTIVQVTSSYTILKVSPVFSRHLFSYCCRFMVVLDSFYGSIFFTVLRIPRNQPSYSQMMIRVSDHLRNA